MADAPGSRWEQLKSTSRHGSTGTFGQSSDGTGERANQAIYDGDGNLTDGGPPARWSADTGSTNAYALTFTPWPTVADGFAVKWRANSANTGAATVSIQGVPYPLEKLGGQALTGGEIASGQMVEAVYDSGFNAFQLLGTSSIQLETNNLANGSQSKLDLIAGSNVTLTDDGRGGITIASTAGADSGTWYGQVPRGTQDGSNRNFQLDYTLASPYTLLSINGIIQKPWVDGSGTFASPDYTVNGSTLTFTVAPVANDWIYCWYFRGNQVEAQQVTAATITAWCAFTADSGNSPGFPYIHWISADGSQDVELDSNSAALFPLTEITKTVPLPSNPTTASWSGTYVRFAINGTVFQQSNPSHILVYDVYLTVQLANGGFATIRPYTYRFNSGSHGTTTTNSSWEPNTNYAQGLNVIDSNGNIQLATNNGTSGSSNPNWGTAAGQLTSDGTMTWQYNGAQTSDTGQITNPTLAYDVENSPPVTNATYTRSFYNGFSDPGIFDVLF